MHDWLRSSTGGDEFNCEVYGNFLLRDTRTGELSSSHGVRSLEDASHIKETPDFRHSLSSKVTSRHLARALLNGSALRHLAGIFAGSDRHVVGLVQVVLCVDAYSSAPWLRRLAPSQIYEA